jgi:hypothetical protein
VFSISIDKPLIDSECEFTLSIIDKLDDLSDIKCSWENAPNLNNIYVNLIDRNKNHYIYGDSINKIFEQYFNDSSDDCFKIAMLNKQLTRYLNRIYNKKC